MLKHFTLLIAFTSLPLTSTATEWIVAGTSHRSVIALDSASIKKINESEFMVWIKAITLDEASSPNLTDPKFDAHAASYSQSVILWNVNCRNRSTGVNRIIMYDKKGGVNDDVTFDKIEMKRVLSGSFSEAIVKQICV